MQSAVPSMSSWLHWLSMCCEYVEVVILKCFGHKTLQHCRAHKGALHWWWPLEWCSLLVVNNAWLPNCLMISTSGCKPLCRFHTRFLWFFDHDGPIESRALVSFHPEIGLHCSLHHSHANRSTPLVFAHPRAGFHRALHHFFKINGYAGKREGIGGSLRLEYQF